MLIGLTLVAGGLALLYVGAEGLVRGSAALALRAGLTPLVVGLTVVAFGTSSPELIVSIQASLTDSGDIALGNVVGSNICNIALILGLSAAVQSLKVQAQLLRLDVPIMIFVTGLLLLLLRDGALIRPEGFLLTLGILLYTGFNIWLARRTQHTEVDVGPEAIPALESPLWRIALLTLGGLGLLLLGGRLLVNGAVSLASDLGLSEAFIGLTIVAIGTSTPELATSIVATLKGEGDIAIGNVVGSNVFNVLGILGIASLTAPLRSDDIDAVDLSVMMALALLLFPLMRTGFRIARWEGMLLVAVYVSYIYYLLP